MAWPDRSRSVDVGSLLQQDVAGDDADADADADTEVDNDNVIMLMLMPRSMTADVSAGKIMEMGSSTLCSSSACCA